MEAGNTKMSLSVKITLQGEKVDHALDMLGQKLVMFEEAFDDIGENLTSYFSGQVYASQGQILGEEWPELSEKYEAWKSVNYPGRPPLIRTGEMQSSYNHESTDTSLTIYNESDHFAYHQSTEPRNVIPRRATMAVNEDVRSIIAYIFDQDIRRKIGSVGLA
jgi:hypothetical protein